ncbi:MAG: NUDIX hydrolase, partial [Rhizobiaceae bacterium]|nr:NUDIX hydrolase [Rhizobiaceae bacterium]
MQEAPTDNGRTTDDGLADIEQAGAICLQRSASGTLRVLLVGSRRNGRWGLPKGHVEIDETTAMTAIREAFEEAGVCGLVDDQPFGSFTYFKDGVVRRYRVTAHVVEVRSIAKSFPEKTIRKCRWFSIEQAAAEASQPGLRELLEKM